MLRLAVLLLAMPLLPSAVAASAQAPMCRAELSAVDDSFDETLARLDRAFKAADLGERCAAVAHHIDVMTRGHEIFARCLPPGHDREENLGQLAVSIGDFRDIQANLKCPVAGR